MKTQSLRQMELNKPLSWGAALWAGLLLFVLAWIAVRIGLHTAFWYQGFDEPLKGDQVWKGEYRLNHPPMMVALAHYLGSLTGKLNSYEDGVFWAREVVAFFGALGIAALGTMAARRRGIAVAFISFGLILCLSFFQHNVRVAKEEPLLFAGFAVCCLAVAWREDRRSAWSAACLGAAVAFALSTKYVGVLTLPLSLVALWLLPREGKRLQDGLCWLLGLILGCLLFLAPAWLNWEKTMDALEGEFAHMTEVKPALKDDSALINPQGLRRFWSRLGGDKHVGLIFFAASLALVFLPNKLRWYGGMKRVN